MIKSDDAEQYDTGTGADDQFVRSSLRHLSELRQIAQHTARPNQAFPEGWFDVPERQLADLGAMFFLTSMSAFHRTRTIAQSIAALEPPLRLAQYHIFRSNGYPRAYVTWAGLDPEAEQQFAVERVPLRPEQWNSGTSKWVADLVAPFGHLEQVIRQLSKSEQANRLRTLWHNRKGTRARVIEWERASKDAKIVVRSYGHSQFKRHLQEG